MKALRLLVYLSALFVALTNCAREPELRVQFPAMGTLVTLTIYGADESTAMAAIAEVETLLKELETQWHPWAEGELALANRALAQGQVVELSPELAELVRRSIDLSNRSGGLFHPGLGKLTRLWGFDAGRPQTPAVPDTQQIEDLLINPTALVIVDQTITSEDPDFWLDFGGYAKGVALDLAVERLRAAGIEHAILNMGGDLRGFGHRGDRSWRVGIRHPRREGIIGGIKLQGDESVVTSGDYERYFEIDGQRYHHILDPRSGYPATGTQAVTVIHTEASVADAAATALMVAGPDDWAEIAKALEIEYVLLIDAEGRLHMSPAMTERLALEIDDPVLVVSE